MNAKTENVDSSFHPTFSPAFLEDHARRLVTNPKIALVELVANCWDAGADTVNITWPKESIPEEISIEDNGTGLSDMEFRYIWLAINYNRVREQGELVVFPEGNQNSKRRAYGRNGKGRHSMFCFSDKYRVETWKTNQANTYEITKTTTVSQLPFKIESLKSQTKQGHGTRIWTTLGRNYISIDEVRDLIGSKFITDPTFSVFLNKKRIELASLSHLTETKKVRLDSVGDILISLVDTQISSKTSSPHGVAWWVSKRLVGETSWNDFRDTYELDRRTIEAKRFTFVVQADCLNNDVSEDWSEFKDTKNTRRAKDEVEKHIRQKILESMTDLHKTRKINALSKNYKSLVALPAASRYSIGRAIDKLQEKMPSLNEKTLTATVEVLSNLEEARTGFKLLEQLSNLGPDDLDKLSQILDTWTVHEARVVLGELEWRLKIIEKLEQIVESPSTDELHEIQPLFALGLWIFGPEYESIHYTSNKTLLTVLRDFFKSEIPQGLAKKKRPDFVALPNSTLGIYASNSFNESSEVNGFEKVLIVELKRGGFTVGLGERRQAEDYAREIRKSGRIGSSTEIIAFVLGSKVAGEVQEELKEGNTKIITRPYAVVIQQAHARTFFLAEKIKQAKGEELLDPEVEKVIKSSFQSKMI